MLTKGERLEKIYSVFPWPEDLHSVEGRRRFEEACSVFREVIEHPWVRSILGKQRIRVLDVCGGTGIGGIALAKVLIERGLGIELVINDLRASALDKAARYAKEVLGIDIETLCCDATELHRLGVKADIVLMYGVSTPHFDPYRMIQLSASLARVVNPEGVVLIEEFDRVYGLLCRVGFRALTVERADEESAVITLDAGYDVKRGVFRRLFLDLVSMNRAVMEYRMWDVASVAAILWVFFRDVDFKPLRSYLRGFLIAKEPRGLDPDEYRSLPSIAEGS